MAVVNIMPEEESIEIPISEESYEEEAPSEEFEQEEEVVEEEQPTIEEQLFELPDGRKVDADTLQNEWKNNFLPDYTRKSQELATIKNGNSTSKEEEAQSLLADPDYVPESYLSLAEQIKAELRADLAREEKSRIEQQQAVENLVIEQLEGVKAIDPNVDENRLFLHANKYGFRDLKVAYENMKDMNQMVKTVQKTTAQNIAKRNDPVSVSPGAIGTRPDPSAFGSAVEYMRSLNN